MQPSWKRNSASGRGLAQAALGTQQSIRMKQEQSWFEHKLRSVGKGKEKSRNADKTVPKDIIISPD